MKDCNHGGVCWGARRVARPRANLAERPSKASSRDGSSCSRSSWPTSIIVSVWLTSASCPRSRNSCIPNIVDSRLVDGDSLAVVLLHLRP